MENGEIQAATAPFPPGRFPIKAAAPAGTQHRRRSAQELDILLKMHMFYTLKRIRLRMPRVIPGIKWV